MKGHNGWVNEVAFSPDEKQIATVAKDGTTRVWDATTGDDHTTHIWDPLSGKDLMIFREDSDATSGAAGVAFSPDGKYVVTSSWDGVVRLSNVMTGREVRRFLGHSGPAFGAAFSPDGKYVLSSGNDETARLWDVKTGQQVRLFAGDTN